MKAQGTLDQAAEVCLSISTARNAAEDQLDTLHERRRQLWNDAQLAGAKYDDIAHACGVARSLVIREIARYRQKEWAR